MHYAPHGDATALFHTVLNIVIGSPDKQVLRVHTITDIAFMEDVQAHWDRANEYLVSHTVC